MDENDVAQIAKEITLAFADKLHVRNTPQDDQFNANMAQAVTTFYETMYRKVKELVTESK